MGAGDLVSLLGLGTFLKRKKEVINRMIRIGRMSFVFFVFEEYFFKDLLKV